MELENIINFFCGFVISLFCCIILSIFSYNLFFIVFYTIIVLIITTLYKVVYDKIVELKNIDTKDITFHFLGGFSGICISLIYL